MLTHYHKENSDLFSQEKEGLFPFVSLAYFLAL